jgi:lysozyme family protein
MQPFKVDKTSPFYSENFGDCLAFVIAQEGGDSNDRHDPGGATHRGIIQREYDAYRDTKHEPRRSVFLADDIEIQEIYWIQYFMPTCQHLPAGLDLCYFDQCVNEGPVQATKELQRALQVKDDGHFGIITMQAVQTCPDIEGLIKAYTARRIDFYKALKTFQWFGRGWTSRAIACQTAALCMCVA